MALNSAAAAQVRTKWGSRASERLVSSMPASVSPSMKQAAAPACTSTKGSRGASWKARRADAMACRAPCAESTRPYSCTSRRRHQARQACARAWPSSSAIARRNACAVLESASVRYRIAVGPIAGRKTLRLQAPGALSTATQVTKRLTASRDGFSLNAAVACRAGERKKLERLCRYVARPPLALERLGRDGDGLVVHRLKRPFGGRTTEFLFEPLDFLARLAALVPRPRSHLLRYHGVLAPNARQRRLVVPAPGSTPAARDDDTPAPMRAPMSWIQRLRYVFDIEPRAGARAAAQQCACWQ